MYKTTRSSTKPAQTISNNNTAAVAERSQNNALGTTKIYSTWGLYLKLHLSDIIGEVTRLTQYTNRRIQVFNSFTFEELVGASIDFTTAYYLSSLPIENKSYWLQLARERVVSLHDIKSDSTIRYTAIITLFLLIFSCRVPQFTLVCLLGNSGSGKTTLAILILMCLGGKATCETRDRKTIHYINGPNVMYSGVVFDTAANIGIDHILEPSLHLQAWRDMSPRPTIFLVDGGKFVDLKLLQEVSVLFNCSVAVFDLSVPSDTTQGRCETRKRQPPRSWPAIARNQQDARDWAKEAPPNTSYLILQNTSIHNNTSTILANVGLGDIFVQGPQPDTHRYILSQLEYI
jgi:hypothetical protein